MSYIRATPMVSTLQFMTHPHFYVFHASVTMTCVRSRMSQALSQPVTSVPP